MSGIDQTLSGGKAPASILNNWDTQTTLPGQRPSRNRTIQWIVLNIFGSNLKLLATNVGYC